MMLTHVKKAVIQKSEYKTIKKLIVMSCNVTLFFLINKVKNKFSLMEKQISLFLKLKLLKTIPTPSNVCLNIAN